MMVITIVGITIAIVTPQLMDIGDVRAKGAMRRLQGTVRYLFNESVFRKRAFQLHIDIEKAEYWVDTPQITGGTVENVQTKDSFIDKRTALPPGIKVVDVQSPRIGKKSDGEAVIQFFPYGFVEPATIHIEDQHKVRFTLFIQPLTGTVKILPGYVEVTRKS
jgi:general secretion pathway protein H